MGEILQGACHCGGIRMTLRFTKMQGAGNDVIRLSVGIETAADLIDDLDRAMS